MKLFKKLKRKHYNLRSELAKWVEKNIGPGYIDEALENYDKINSGVPIGGMAETVAFVRMVETVKAEVEGRCKEKKTGKKSTYYSAVGDWLCGRRR